jgi:hypothetical protein
MKCLNKEHKTINFRRNFQCYKNCDDRLVDRHRYKKRLTAGLYDGCDKDYEVKYSYITVQWGATREQLPVSIELDNGCTQDPEWMLWRRHKWTGTSVIQPLLQSLYRLSYLGT